MNLRCFYCQTPFTLSRAEILAALQQMDSENMNHYDAHCPRCRRANSVSRQRLEMFLPNWREAAAEQAATPPAAEEQPTRMPAGEGTAPAPVAVMPPAQAMPMEAEPKPRHSRKRAGNAKKTTPAQKAKKPAPAKANPAAGKSKSKPAAKSPAKATKTATKSRKK